MAQSENDNGGGIMERQEFIEEYKRITDRACTVAELKSQHSGVGFGTYNRIEGLAIVDEGVDVHVYDYGYDLRDTDSFTLTWEELETPDGELIEKYKQEKKDKIREKEKAEIERKKLEAKNKELGDKREYERLKKKYGDG